MKTDMSETSLAAYRRLLGSGAELSQKEKILLLFESGGSGAEYTIATISMITGLPINAASGRVSDLVKKDKLLEYGGVELGGTGKLVRLPKGQLVMELMGV